MHITVLGATGGTGRHLVAQALAAGHQITAIVRRPEALADFADRVTVRRADARDPASLVEALAGVPEVVVNIVGASSLWEARKTTDLYSVTATNLLAAMGQHGAPRLVVVSSGGVEPQPNDGLFYRYVLKPVFLARMYEDMLRMERVVEGGPAPWTIVRAPYLRGDALTGQYRVSRGVPLPDDDTLSRPDLAHLLLRLATEPGWTGERVWASY
jgi:uncharacterized protein YbjT (DUF2867 family)